MAEHVTSLESELKIALERWRKQAVRYFQLGDKEKDPLGAKFYQSSAMAIANCIFDVEAILGVERRLSPEVEQALMEKTEALLRAAAERPTMKGEDRPAP